jgi:hypothetical protein
VRAMLRSGVRMAPEVARTGKKKRRGRPRNECVQHVIEFHHWDFDYMFGIDTGRFSDGPYMDYRHLNIKGKILRPTSIGSWEPT